MLGAQSLDQIHAGMLLCERGSIHGLEMTAVRRDRPVASDIRAVADASQ
jgi:hypothetical protein